MSANGRNRGYIGRNEITSSKGVIDGRQNYLNEEEKNWNYGTDWVRPSDWLSIPGYTLGEQVAYGLLSVTNTELQSNSIGLLVSGNFIIDWGDGVTESFTSGTTVRRSYNYSSISSSTLTTEGYKQILVKITPQAGSNLTTVNFSPQGITGANANMMGKWLEINCNLPQCSTFRIANIEAPNPYIKKLYLNSLAASCSIDRMGSFPALESIYFPLSSTLTNPQHSFATTLQLKQPPFIKIGNTSMYRAFFQSRIESIPVTDYSLVNRCDSAFQDTLIKSVPFDLNLSNVTTNSADLFNGCYFLENVKSLNLSNATTPIRIFQNCVSLKKIETINVSKATSLLSFFNNCQSLKTITSFVGGTGIQSTQSMFNGCRSLQQGITLDLTKCTDAGAMYYNCLSLKSVPGYTFGNNATVRGMFSNCMSLAELPEMDFSNIAIVDGGVGEAQRFTYFCFALEKFPVKNLRVSMSLLNCRFGFTALSEVFAGLTGISGASATLTITGNPGASGITAGQIAGATAKGWTIVL